MLLDDRVAYRKAQTSTLTRTSGREKRVENVLQILLCYALPRVAERDAHTTPWLGAARD